jgi:hypothetical protein
VGGGCVDCAQQQQQQQQQQHAQVRWEVGESKYDECCFGGQQKISNP